MTALSGIPACAGKTWLSVPERSMGQQENHRASGGFLSTKEIRISSVIHQMERDGRQYSLVSALIEEQNS